MRRSRRTTKQIKNAPFNAIFVWCSNNLSYPQTLCYEHSRTDIKVLPLSSLHNINKFRGIGVNRVVIDHAAYEGFTPRMQETYNVLKNLKLFYKKSEMIFNPNKPVQTRDGRKARIVCTDRNTLDGHPILALIEGHLGAEYLKEYDKNGKINTASDSIFDLVNILQKRKGYMNIYYHDEIIDFGKVYDTRQEADEISTADRISCIEFEYKIPS